MKWYDIQAKAGAKSAEIFVYGPIGTSWWEESVTAKQFVQDLAALGDVTDITVRINSVGGSVPDGLAIFNALRRHPASITTAVDGIAASIASLIFMAGDTRQVAENSQLMLHAPWGVSIGNAVEMRRFADQLDGWSKGMATSYAAPSGKSVEDVLSLITDGEDHWYGADEALAEGFATEITPALAIAASFDLSAYKNLPPAAARFNLRPGNSMKPNEPQPTAQPGAAQPSQPAAPAALDPAAVQAAAAAAVAADRTRVADIEAKFERWLDVDGVRPLLATCRADGSSVQAAGEKLLDLLGSRSSPANRIVVTVADERDKMVAAVASAIEIRAQLVKNDAANPYRGHSLMELARMCLRSAGYRDFGDKMQDVAAAFTHSTSDFPKILENIANKSMLKGYEAVAETFQRWTAKGSLPDFKVQKRVDMNMFPSLAVVPEGAEFQYATIGERGESIVLATYGRLFSITRQAIINDDLSMFTRIPERMGRAAKRTVGDLVYAVLTGNPTMSDGTALFHTDHANLPTGAAISTDSLSAMRTAMALQKDPDSLAAALGIAMKYLIVPMALADRAAMVLNSEFYVGASSTDNTVPNTMRGQFEPIAEARLDAASSTAWYGAASASMHDTVEVCYLDGNETPFLDRQEGWKVDGVEFKVRLDVGVKALDFRGLAKNVGP